MGQRKLLEHKEEVQARKDEADAVTRRQGLARGTKESIAAKRLAREETKRKLRVVRMTVVIICSQRPFEMLSTLFPTPLKKMR